MITPHQPGGAGVDTPARRCRCRHTSPAVQVFAEIGAALRNEPPPPEATLRQAVADLLWHTHQLADWRQDSHLASVQMRRFVPLYLHGFESARELQARLMRAAGAAGYQKAADFRDWDPGEAFPAASARLPRLKGGAHGAVRRVKLPHGWLDDAWRYDVDALGAGACEG